MDAEPHQFRLARALVQEILREPLGHPWVLRGFGRLLRLPLGDGLLLHVWDPERDGETVTRGASLDFAVPGGLSPFGLHTHPWPMRSTVLAGTVVQCLYVDADDGEDAEEYLMQRTVGGADGHGQLDGEPERVRLVERRDVYRAGEFYEQAADEIHKSLPEPGTVTLVEALPLVGDAPRVYLYREGAELVPAVPDDPPTPETIRAFAQKALAGWDAR